LVLLVAGFPVVTVVEAGSAGVRSVGPARRTAAAAGRGPACPHRAPPPGAGVWVGAGSEGEGPGGVSSRGIARPATGGLRGVPGGGAGRAGSAGVRSVGAARRTGSGAGRGPAVALRAGRAVVGGYVDAGLERDVHGGVSSRGIARPARVGLNDVHVAARESGDRRVRDRERWPEEAVRDQLAAVADAAAIRVRCAAHVRVNAGTGAAGPAARGGETR